MDLPADDALHWIVRSYAALRASHGDAIGAPQLVQPTADFFPDEFRRDAASVARLLHRMVTYSPLADDLPVQVAFLEPSETEGDGAGGCGSPACGSGGGSRARTSTVEELENGYRVFVSVADIAHPEVLTASLARTVGALVLREGGGQVDEEGGAMSEIASVACGFGVLLANGAAVWAKSCGGLRMARATALSVEEIGVALALFLTIHRRAPSEARAHAPATQREALDHALAWAESNPLLVETLRDRPAQLERGLFDLEPVRGALGRWLHRRKLEKDMRAAPAARSVAPSPQSADKRRRLAEARALVDEVLGEE
jgi:hypothetical protein